MLPREFPPWKGGVPLLQGVEVREGTWERLNRTMRRLLREKLGTDPEPSAGIVDAQSAKTTGVGGEQRGFDGGKNIRGRKRHLLVDTEGLVVEAKVHSAKVPDQDGIRRLLEPARSRLPRLSYLWVDACSTEVGARIGSSRHSAWRSRSSIALPSPRPRRFWRSGPGNGSRRGTRWILASCPRARVSRTYRARRWVAERTFAWISHNRRMAKDYERMCSTGEAFIHAAMTRLIVRRLARA